jgi:predicted lipoprotein with Yx(FWY)xxD motif
MRTPKLLALVLAAGLVLAACGDDSSTSTEDTSAPSADATTTTAASATAATVRLESGGELGDHLVDAQGFTLYLFEKDQGTTTACTGGCTTNWPAATASGTPVAGPGVDGSKLATASTGQLTYDGHLLYRFAGDKAAGDTNGTKVAAWYAVGPDGKAIELDEDEGTSSTQATMGGADY